MEFSLNGFPNDEIHIAGLGGEDGGILKLYSISCHVLSNTSIATVAIISRMQAPKSEVIYWSQEHMILHVTPEEEIEQ
ncbi:hypothetical protein B7P43_G08468 [Cryptotermes secundus]|uniref:Uncharacterized protein n=1 Tax=Cryptotermes secundus TaxID=105785 RepID=A0A2J7R5Z5_9NEOP|nr:hypothetical protein B7P43_G08468 [Cryptotermes secundus]